MVTDGGARVDRYLSHLDALMGVEPVILPVASTTAGQPGLFTLTYNDHPEPGMLTGFTCGISRDAHPAWVNGKPELCISVRSTDDSWVQALGWITEQARGTCAFAYGDVLNVGERIAAESAMTAFVIFAPPLDPSDALLGIDVGDTLPINISGAYPIHESEREFISTNGLLAFWDRDWDPHDITRPACI